jgi:hypothetical protein
MGANTLSSDGIRAFAGPRDDPFFVDLGATFRLAAAAHSEIQDRQRGGRLGNYNVHTIALEIPISPDAHGRGDQPAHPIRTRRSASGRLRAVQRRRRDAPGSAVSSGAFVQVSRLGMPLVNEAVIPLGVKDTFNGLEPTGDGAALSFVTNPTVPPLLEALFGLKNAADAAQRSRHDLPDRHPGTESDGHAIRGRPK